MASVAVAIEEARTEAWALQTELERQRGLVESERAASAITRASLRRSVAASQRLEGRLNVLLRESAAADDAASARTRAAEAAAAAAAAAARAAAAERARVAGAVVAHHAKVAATMSARQAQAALHGTMMTGLTAYTASAAVTGAARGEAVRRLEAEVGKEAAAAVLGPLGSDGPLRYGSTASTNIVPDLHRQVAARRQQTIDDAAEREAALRRWRAGGALALGGGSRSAGSQSRLPPAGTVAMLRTETRLGPLLRSAQASRLLPRRVAKTLAEGVGAVGGAGEGSAIPTMASDASSCVSRLHAGGGDDAASDAAHAQAVVSAHVLDWIDPAGVGLPRVSQPLGTGVLLSTAPAWKLTSMLGQSSLSSSQHTGKLMGDGAAPPTLSQLQFTSPTIAASVPHPALAGSGGLSAPTTAAGSGRSKPLTSQQRVQRFVTRALMGSRHSLRMTPAMASVMRDMAAKSAGEARPPVRDPIATPTMTSRPTTTLSPQASAVLRALPSTSTPHTAHPSASRVLAAPASMDWSDLWSPAGSRVEGGQVDAPLRAYGVEEDAPPAANAAPFLGPEESVTIIVGDEAKAADRVELPSDALHFTVDDVGWWLTRLGYAQYRPHFAAAGIDGPCLLQLAGHDFVRLVGMRDHAHITAVVAARDRLRAASAFTVLAAVKLGRAL